MIADVALHDDVIARERTVVVAVHWLRNESAHERHEEIHALDVRPAIGDAHDEAGGGAVHGLVPTEEAGRRLHPEEVTRQAALVVEIVTRLHEVVRVRLREVVRAVTRYFLARRLHRLPLTAQRKADDSGQRRSRLSSISERM